MCYDEKVYGTRALRVPSVALPCEIPRGGVSLFRMTVKERLEWQQKNNRRCG